MLIKFPPAAQTPAAQPGIQDLESVPALQRCDEVASEQGEQEMFYWSPGTSASLWQRNAVCGLWGRAIVAFEKFDA